MKKAALILLGLLLAAPAWAARPDIKPYDKARAAADGLLIAETANDFNRPEKDLVVYAVMTLKSGDQVVDTRKVIIKQKTYGDLDRGLFRFMDSLKRGVTFLTIENKSADNDQHLYVPALGRSRKVASADRQKDFEDTDFTNEHLGGLKVEDYEYARRKDKKIRGGAAYKIKAKAKDPDARFPRHVSWIDQQTFVPLQMKIYNRDNKLQKVMAAGDIRKVGSVNLPFKTVIKDLERNHTTILDVKKAEADTGLDGVLFDKDKMGEKWPEAF